MCEKEREFFLLFFDYYGLRKRERERERERDSRIIIFFVFFVDAFETHFCLVVFPERSFEYCCVLFAVAKPRCLRRSKKDHHLYLVEKEEEEKRRRKREVSNKIVLFSRERRID